MTRATLAGKTRLHDTRIEGSRTQGRGYPPHLVPGNLFCHRWHGKVQIGRVTTCQVCGVTSETRNRNGDARFIRAHRRCGFAPAFGSAR